MYRLERRGLLDCPIIGVASDDITTEQLVKHAREATVDSGQDVDDAVFDRRIDPDPGLRLQLSALAGQSWRTVHLDTSFARELGEPPEPYEVLLHAAMVGDHQYFAREDSVEETWRIVQPLLDHPPDVRPYPRGSWGPEEAETLLRGHPRWQQPWLPEEG